MDRVVCRAMRGRPRFRPTTVGVRALVALLMTSVVACGGRAGNSALGSRRHLAMTQPNPASVFVRDVLLGRSVLGRPIAATEIRARNAHTRILVVGCIHGNEPA